MDNFKKWGIIAGIIYLLSLPIAIWRSSRIGKLIFIFFFVMISGYAIKTLTTVGLESFYKISFRAKVENMKKCIDVTEKGMSILQDRITDINTDLSKKVENRYNEEIINTKTKLSELEEKIKELETGLILIREEERNTLKENLIAIREQIKVFNKSIDSKEIRTEVEKIATNIKLLTPDEQRRLYADLEEVGFGIKRVNDNVVAIEGYNYRGQIAYTAASGCVVGSYAMPTVYINNEINIDY